MCPRRRLVLPLGRVLPAEHEFMPALARIDLRQRTLSEPVESLTFWLIPTPVNPPSTTFPHGVLKFAWGNTELSADWRVGR